MVHVQLKLIHLKNPSRLFYLEPFSSRNNFPLRLVREMVQDRRVTYIHQEDLQRAADALPSNKSRASLVHSLIVSLGLLEVASDDSEGEESRSSSDTIYTSKARVVESTPATRNELEAFHDVDYVST